MEFRLDRLSSASPTGIGIEFGHLSRYHRRILTTMVIKHLHVWNEPPDPLGEGAGRLLASASESEERRRHARRNRHRNRILDTPDVTISCRIKAKKKANDGLTGTA